MKTKVYITKEAAYSAINKSLDYIQDLQITRGLLLDAFGMAKDSMERISNIPEEDVVKVVRCKDCIHYETTLTGSCCTHIDGLYSPNDEDFCSYGERRNQE